MNAARGATPPPAAEPGALYPTVFAASMPFGRCAAVDLATAATADPTTLTALLHPSERALCAAMRGARLVEFVGGRIAARRARAGMPDADGPTLRGPGGMPMAAGCASLSLSHSRRYAVALARKDGPGSVGIDIEPLDADGDDTLLAERILSDAECQADAAGEPIPLIRRLSLKEAAYKALYPSRGPVPLRALSVLRSKDGGFRLATRGGEELGAAAVELDGHVLSLALRV